MVLALDGDRRAQPLVQTPLNEQNGDIRRDGRWVAYQSDESGQNEVFVRPFPNAGAGRGRRFSTGGGTRPLWARTGQELFYVAPSGSLMSVGIERGANFVAGNPARLFEGRYFMGVAGETRPGQRVERGVSTYVSPDGRRFLMIKPVAATEQTVAPPGIVVVQNWFEVLDAAGARQVGSGLQASRALLAGHSSKILASRNLCCLPARPRTKFAI